MCGYQVFRTYHPSGPLPPIPVYAPAGAPDRLDRAIAVEPATPMSSLFDFVTLAPGTLEIGPFTLTAEHMNHPVETFGFRIEHGGRAIAYSADTGPSASLVRLAADADVLLCEASFAEVGGLPPDLHLTARQAGEHAANAGVGELMLTHLVPWNDAEESLARAASACPGPVLLARPGVEVTAARQ
jgi:ribonuclease BN (tRNA processing enzyme)